VIDAPCGTSSCALMPGGGAMVGFRHTKAPKLVARYMQFAARRGQTCASQLAARRQTSRSATLAREIGRGLSTMRRKRRGARHSRATSARLPAIPAPPPTRSRAGASRRAAMNAMDDANQPGPERRARHRQTAARLHQEGRGPSPSRSRGCRRAWDSRNGPKAILGAVAAGPGARRLEPAMVLSCSGCWG